MKLNARKIKNATLPGRYGDGGGLYLHVRPGGSRQWLLRTIVQKKRVDIHIGSASHFSLAEARDEARRLRKLARTGHDPLADRRKLADVPTFREAAYTVWEHTKPTWKNRKHVAQWIHTLEEFAFPVIGDKRIEDISSAHILDVLTPIWTDKPETARRVRQRLRSVFDWAKAARHRSGDNPVEAVKLALPKQTEKVKHHTALPWQDLPEFMTQLVQRDAVSAKALKILILTATRSGEVRLAYWSELEGDVWVAKLHSSLMIS